MPPLTTLLQLPAVDFHALPGFLSTPAIANLDFNLYMPHLLLPFSFAPPLLAVPPAPELLHIEDTFPVAEEKALDTIPTPTVVADAEFDAADDAADDVYSCTCASNKPPIEFTDISVPKEVLTSLGNPFEIRVRGDLSELSSLQPHERWEVLKQLTVLASGEVTPGEMVAMGLGPIQPGIEAIAAASSSSKSETMGDGDATEEGEEEAAPEWLNTSFTKFVVPVSRCNPPSPIPHSRESSKLIDNDGNRDTHGALGYRVVCDCGVSGSGGVAGLAGVL